MNVQTLSIRFAARRPTISLARYHQFAAVTAATGRPTYTTATRPTSPTTAVAVTRASSPIAKFSRLYGNQNIRMVRLPSFLLALIPAWSTPNASVPNKAAPYGLQDAIGGDFTTKFGMMASKITEWVHPGDSSGEFKRQRSSFRDQISREAGAQYPPEKGRYHLYVSYACPWASRTLIVRKLKGLEDIISFSVVHWHLGSQGWRFVTADEKDVPGENVTPDPYHPDFTHLRQVYFESASEYQGRFTVPVLYDTKTRTIVNNESSEIIRMLGTEFNDLVADEFKSVDLYPAALQKDIDETGEWTYDLINNGVYKSGFATTQQAYERNVVALFQALDKAEAHLKSQGEDSGPYYFGKTITEADVRLYVTLIRFDPVYVQHFKCNIRDIRSGYPYLHRWMRNLYWNVPAFHDTTQFEHIKWHYTKSHTQINPHSITPVGPLPDIFPLDDEVVAAKSPIRA